MRRVILAVLVVGALVFGSATAAMGTPAALTTGTPRSRFLTPTTPRKCRPSSSARRRHWLVYKQHITALNNCDWLGLMQQYPDQYTLRQSGAGALVSGRLAAAATFAGFVKPHATGGLCGGKFTALSMSITDETVAVSWVFNAPFLAAPYYGADAYITDDGLMVSMVSTFDGNQLQYKP